MWGRTFFVISPWLSSLLFAKETPYQTAYNLEMAEPGFELQSSGHKFNAQTDLWVVTTQECGVSWGYPKKLPEIGGGGLQTTEIYCLMSIGGWIPNQGVCMTLLPLKASGRRLPCFFLTSGGLLAIPALLGLWMCNSTPLFVSRASASVSVSLESFLFIRTPVILD